MHTVSEKLSNFVQAALASIISDDGVRNEVIEMAQQRLAASKARAEAELKQLCDDDQEQPITYNHYYTDNVQNSRLSSTRELIKRITEDSAGVDDDGDKNSTVDVDKILASLRSRVTVDMDEQACDEAEAGLSAYYKVSNCRPAISR